MLARRPGRRGATLPEFALLLTVFLMFLFGVFEYARYLLVLHTITNAARDGARYAVISSSNPNAATFTTDATAADGYSATAPGFSVPFITTYTQARMGGVERMFLPGTFKVRVFPCDTPSLYQNPPVIKPKTQPTATNTIVSWNNAQFGERIAVRIKGDYDTFLPTFLWMSDPLKLDVVAVMGSEG
jgi:Flp pilus assembly protein TadG